MAYCKEFRAMVLKTKEKENLTVRQTSKRFFIGLTTLMRWMKNPEMKKGRNKPPTKIDMEKLKEDVVQYPDAYMYERARRLGVSRTCIQYALKRLGVSYKKNSLSSQGLCRKAVYLLSES